MEVLATSRKLSGFVVPLAEVIMASQPTAETAAPYAETVVKLQGPPNLKEKLAYLLPDDKVAGLNNDAFSRVALAWAASPETHQRSRELIAAFDTRHRPTEIKQLPADAQQAYVRMEGAVRLAVPNLMTEKTAKDLFAGFRATNKLVRPETIAQVKKLMPRELVAKIMENVDFAKAVEEIERQQAAATQTAEGGTPAAT
jgi:hypothetical protein